MRILFIDTETTGLPFNGLSATDPKQARLVQFAATLHDSERVERHTVSLIVRPDVAIPDAATKVHGITNETAELFGVPEQAAIGVFLRLAAKCDAVSGYNVDFDMKVMWNAFIRAQIRTTWPARPIRDVCAACTPIVNLPPTERMIEFGHGDKPKTPKLGEAHEFFFKESLDGAHDALVDVRAAARIYYELEARGVWNEQAERAAS